MNNIDIYSVTVELSWTQTDRPKNYLLAGGNYHSLITTRPAIYFTRLILATGCNATHSKDVSFMHSCIHSG